MVCLEDRVLRRDQSNDGDRPSQPRHVEHGAERDVEIPGKPAGLDSGDRKIHRMVYRGASANDKAENDRGDREQQAQPQQGKGEEVRGEGQHVVKRLAAIERQRAQDRCEGRYHNDDQGLGVHRLERVEDVRVAAHCRADAGLALREQPIREPAYRVVRKVNAQRPSQYAEAANRLDQEERDVDPEKQR